MKLTHSDHHHNYHHAHEGLDSLGRIRSAFLINLLFTIIELVGGYFTNSLAIVSDAIHDLGDSLSLGLAWVLEKYSLKTANADHTYGYKRWSTLSALMSSIVIMTGSLIVIAHSFERLINPEPVVSVGIVGLAILGVTFNLFAYWKLRGGSSLNEKVLKYHLLEDVLGWGVVLFGGVVIYFTNWTWLDPVLASATAIWIFRHVWIHFKSSLKVFMQMWPEGLPLQEVQSFILSFDGIKGVHHVHGWSIDGEHHIVTMHVVLSSQFDQKVWPSLKAKIKAALKEKWNIIELTLESEVENDFCADPAHPH